MQNCLKKEQKIDARIETKIRFKFFGMKHKNQKWNEKFQNTIFVHSLNQIKSSFLLIIFVFFEVNSKVNLHF
jgi:hypothetical protein